MAAVYLYGALLAIIIFAIYGYRGLVDAVSKETAGKRLQSMLDKYMAPPEVHEQLMKEIRERSEPFVPSYRSEHIKHDFDEEMKEIYSVCKPFRTGSLGDGVYAELYFAKRGYLHHKSQLTDCITFESQNLASMNVAKARVVQRFMREAGHPEFTLHVLDRGFKRRRNDVGDYIVIKWADELNRVYEKSASYKEITETKI